jgi:hypothetical protein
MSVSFIKTQGVCGEAAPGHFSPIAIAFWTIVSRYPAAADCRLIVSPAVFGLSTPLLLALHKAGDMVHDRGLHTPALFECPSRNKSRSSVESKIFIIAMSGGTPPCTFRRRVVSTGNFGLTMG